MLNGDTMSQFDKSKEMTDAYTINNNVWFYKS